MIKVVMKPTFKKKLISWLCEHMQDDGVLFKERSAKKQNEIILEDFSIEERVLSNIIHGRVPYVHLNKNYRVDLNRYWALEIHPEDFTLEIEDPWDPDSKFSGKLEVKLVTPEREPPAVVGSDPDYAY